MTGTQTTTAASRPSSAEGTQPVPARASASLAERYRVLLEIGRTLTGAVANEEDLYTALYRESARVLEMDAFYIATYDGTEDLATVVFWADRGLGRLASITYRGSDSDVIRNGRPSLVADLLEDQSVLVIGDGDEQVTRAAVSVPLLHKSQVIGVISAQSYRANSYSQSDLELLQGIGDIAAVALQNVRYVQELDRRRREAERMEEMSRRLAGSLDAEAVLGQVVEAAMDLVDADGAAVWLLDDRRARIAAARGSGAPPVDTRFGLTAELEEHLVGAGRALTFQTPRETARLPEVLHFPYSARSAIVAPLSSEAAIIGGLTLTSARDRHFGAGEIRHLYRLASHAAVALENARLHAALQTLSLTDPLTGLPNRRQLEVHLSHEFAAARRGRPLSVVIFDVDRFKEYNDTEGHVAGDQALRAVAYVLGQETRAMNLVARYGGDEFLAVLSDTDRVGAVQHAMRVHRRVAQDEELGARGIRLSSGVATFSDEMERVEDLIRVADEDMYRAKAARRAE
ncbi:MAG: diguanylate cyclase [Gemmatimonadota bacterium]